jgi:hypothetical protein
LIVGIVSLHLVLRGIAPAPSAREPRAPCAHETSRNLRARNLAQPARTNIAHAKRNRAIRENFAK